MSYDSWLEAPYTEAAERGAEWEAFCDAQDYDYDVEGKDSEFDEWVEARYEPDPDEARDRWLEDRYDDRYED